MVKFYHIRFFDNGINLMQVLGGQKYSNATPLVLLLLFFYIDLYFFH
jgi:hypothetical protein